MTRRTLATIVSQAWVIGAGGGTLAGLMLLALLSSPVPFLGGNILFALIVIPFALMLSIPPYLCGLALVLAAPATAIRLRVPICLAMPPLVSLAAAAVAWPNLAGAVPVAAVVGLDAALASLWCWHRTRAVAGAGATELERIFR